MERHFAFHIKIVAYFRKKHKFFVEKQEVAVQIPNSEKRDSTQN